MNRLDQIAARNSDVNTRVEIGMEQKTLDHRPGSHRQPGMAFPSRAQVRTAEWGTRMQTAMKEKLGDLGIRPHNHPFGNRFERWRYLLRGWTGTDTVHNTAATDGQRHGVKRDKGVYMDDGISSLLLSMEKGYMTWRYIWLNIEIGI